MTGEPKKVLLAGAPTGCWTNAGDEAILAVMVEDLRSITPDVEIVIVSSNPAGALARYRVKEVPYNDITGLLNAAKSADLMILGGGSIFFDYWGFDPGKVLTKDHEGLSFYTGFALLATLLNKPLMIYAVGVGPLHSEMGRTFTRLAFEQAHIATVRDPESKAMLASLGCDTGRVQVTADPVFNFAAADEGRARHIIQGEGGARLARPFIGVALREWGINVDPDAWEPAVASALDDFLARHGGTVLLMPFHRTVDWVLTDDLGVAERVSSRMRRRDRTVIFRGEHPPEEKAAVLRACDLVLGMRLHALIFAIGGGVPTVALTCDPKVSNLLSYIDLREYGIGLGELTPQKIVAALEKAHQSRDGRSRFTVRLGVLADLARRNARLAAELLTGGLRPALTPSPQTADLLKCLELSRALRVSEDQTASDKSRPASDSVSPPPSERPSPGDLALSLALARQSAVSTSEPTAARRPHAGKGRAPRVAYLTNRLLDWETRQPRFGGGERYCLTLGRLLRDLGFDVTFYQTGSTAFEGDYFGFKVIALAAGEWVSEFAYGVSNAFYEASADYDHVIVNIPTYASGRVRDDALLICHDVWFDHDYHQPPIVFRTAEWFAHLYRAFSQPRQIVSVDTNSINVIRALWPELATRMTYLPNWVDTNLFRPPQRREASGLTVLFPRRSEIVRGAGILGAILEKVPHDCRFRWWLGEGTAEGTELVQAVARRDPRLQFYAVSTYEEMAPVYQQADICVIPTLASEATSLACLEGLASGCAVVTTNVGGLPNLIQPGVNGLLVDPLPEQIAAAINRLIEQPQERARLQKAGPRTAQGFRLEVWQQRWVDLLKQLGWLGRPELAGRARETQRPDAIDFTLLKPNWEPASAPPAVVPVNSQSPPERRLDDRERSDSNEGRLTAKYDVICFSIIEWGFRYQRPQQLASQFAGEGHRVFYVSPTRFLPPGEERYTVRALLDNVWEVRLAAPELIDLYIGNLPPDITRYLADGLMALRDDLYITRAVSVVEFATWAPAACLARERFGWPVVYDCMDDWGNFPGMEENHLLHRGERKLAGEADLLVVSSQKLWEKWSGHNRNTVLARDAADFPHFDNPQPNALLGDAPHPVVGFFGEIASWFDLDLMARMARERPGYTFVLIGDVFGVPVAELVALENVRLLGAKPYALMPAYVAHFDACIIPFKMNATAAADVVKFYDYISQGKPVVAPRTREFSAHQAYLYIADDHDDFIRKVDQAVAEDDPALRARRIALARENAWQARLARIQAGIERAQRKIIMSDIIRAMARLMDDGQEISPGEAEATALLKETILRVSAELAEREQAVQVISARLAKREAALRELEMEVKARDEVITARDAAITWLKGNIAELEEAVGRSRSQVVEQRQAAERLARELAEKRKALESLSSEAIEKKAVIVARDEGIEFLRGEVAGLQKRNKSLESQLSRQRGSWEALAAQLRETGSELEKIKTSLGWRLLSRYGRIKYRYLLPAYRLLSLRQTSGRQRIQEPAPAEPSDEGQAVESQGFSAQDDGSGFSFAAGPPESALQVTQAGSADGDYYRSLTLLPRPEAGEIPTILAQSPPDGPLRRPDVICFSIIDWEFRYQRPQQIMSQFAEHGHRVFYISASRFRPDSAAPRVKVTPIKENAYEVQLAAQRMPDVYGEVTAGSNLESLLASLGELRQACNINEAIGYVMIASWGGVALRARQEWGWRLIYDCMDEWENFPGIKRGLLDMEVELVGKADLLVVTAQRLYDKWKGHDRPLVLARNGVDYDFYAEHCRPNHILSDVRHPIIGYYGAIADWFDIELLTYVARHRPDYTFVLLGGVFDVDVTGLKSLPNVRLLGQQPYETMPQYLYHFDACIIPFKINPITEATDPVKVYEYLSGGKPVVSVALPELAPYKDYLYVANDRDDFIAKLDQALKEDGPEMASRRRELARQHTWQGRYRAIAEGLAEATPRASIIVVTYNNLALSKLCLESIVRNTEYPNYEVVVVDNNSADGTQTYLRHLAAQYSHISIILNPENHGFARANNQGITQSAGDYIVLLNNDTIVPPGWLSRLLRHLRVAEVGLVGPVTNFVGNEAKIDVPYQTWGEMENFANQYTWEHDGQVADIHMLAMFCVAFRRDTFEEVGPLDEQFGIGMFEDDDYSQRVKEKGCRVICAADVFVHHFGQAAFKKLIETGEYNPLFDANRARYEAKWKTKWVPHKHAPLRFATLRAPLAADASEVNS